MDSYVSEYMKYLIFSYIFLLKVKFIVDNSYKLLQNEKRKWALTSSNYKVRKFVLRIDNSYCGHRYYQQK